MNEFDQDYTYDGDDFFPDHWSEMDWKNYLGKFDLQVSLFLSLFVSSRNIVNHLDLIGIQMGWCKSQDDEFPNNFFNKPSDPTTIHSHPVTVVTRALYHFLSKNWELYMENTKNIEANLSWTYGNLLHHGERNALLGIASMHEGDNVLAVCHLKNALQVLNLTIETIHKTKKYTLKANILFQDALIACFDLREVWIKVMESCKNQEVDDNDNEE